MIVSLFLFLASLAGLLTTLFVPEYSDLLILAAAITLLSLALLLGVVARRRNRKSGPPPAKNWVLLDGSNVMYWHQNTPRIETVREVLTHLSDLGFSTGVVFDANAGHLLADRYLDDFAFARLLGLPEEQIFVVPKGTPADPFLLATAARVGARIITNDRFRDWADAHPEQTTPEALINGGYRSGALWLNFPKE